MTEVEYQHECSRAELLGLPKPTWDEFLAKRTEVSNEVTEDAEVATEEGQDIDARKEGFRRVGGGLDELNSILSSTQKKLNRFKSVCGSFSNLLKIHLGNKTGNENETAEPSTDPSNSANNETTEEAANENSVSATPTPQHYRKGDTHSELDKLDSLINKAERAELSLSSQNKQMKKFLK